MPRVLVVDDEPGVQESLRMLLKDDCEVVLAASVDEALRALSAAPPDLVLLDLVMPGRSGFDLLSELAAAPDTPPVFVPVSTTTGGTWLYRQMRNYWPWITSIMRLKRVSKFYAAI